MTDTRLSPFDFVNSINDKKYLMVSPEVERMYNPFVVNRALSSSVDCLPYLHFLNTHPDLPNKMAYDYLYHGLRKQKRYGKWAKESKHEYLEDVIKFYQVSKNRAAEIIERLSEEQLVMLRKRQQNTGGRMPSVNTP